MRIVDMRIAELEVTWGPWHRQWNIVCIDTDEGLSGLGEAAGSPLVVKSILREYRDLLDGKDPTNVEHLLRSMLSHAYAGFTASHFDAGTAVHAAGAVETALWDISGRAADLPIYALLGGKHRSKIRLYACVGGLETYRSMAPVYRELGINLLKFDTSPPSVAGNPGALLDIHVTRKGIAHLLQIIESIREEVGEDREIAVEGRCGSLTNAVRFMRAIEPYGLAWAEDLLPPTNPDCWSTVTSAGSTPTLTGEGLHLRHEFHSYFQKDAMRIASPDFQVCGGLSEGKKIAELADLYHLTVAPHNAASAIGIAAALHACASIPNLLALEFHAMPGWDRILVDPGISIADGFMEVPELPGLGVTLDEDEAMRYAKGRRELFSPL